ncbi:ATP-dependent helicase [Mesorhizobium sp.]|uniref:ATP-dependent helicase n=1 Tax=Mesorhizobium sp. TaxID=1871066 RepID=UPI000FE6960F|nr:ATP-dependent helicase [Mesorhizobium sp.]RWE53352.1 MAG: ATP-dependent helicase [Mesorhizobium sp.]
MTEAFRSRLSPEQLSAASYVEGPLLVVAGPGSGKTRVLTERIRHLLTSVPGHFRVLALTFTHKAADEMKERLADLGDARDRAFIGTLHGFCLEVLMERGKFVGIEGALNIFEQSRDRHEVLEKAIEEDPFLSDLLAHIGDSKERHRRIERWLSSISYVKSHPISSALVEDEETRRVMEAYEAGMRASNVYDFDDLLLLTYKLLVNNPKIGDIYRRLYKFICVDEAQDMNEAQFAVIMALCSDGNRNVMMVGDPRQSIYGFNTSGPEYMERFGVEFGARRVELTANYRSSRAVVDFAQTLDSNYMVHQQLPVQGLVTVLRGADEKDEARQIVATLERLFEEGHPDVEGGVQPGKCAVLGRTRYSLLAVEAEMSERGIAFYKRFSANHENESDVVDDFLVALRVLANPKDRLHLSALAKRWRVAEQPASNDFLASLETMSAAASSARAETVRNAIVAVSKNTSRLDLMPALAELRKHADDQDGANRLAIYEDVEVLQQEWDQFLRTVTGARNITAFMSSKALGGTQKTSREGVALLTVHSSKGLEFDVVFLVGMAEGIFPDYRAIGGKALAEESRNAFVAATRARRLLYLSYPATRVMPWGGVRPLAPSSFLNGALS